MRFKKILRPWCGWMAVVCFLLTFTGLAAQAKDLKFEARLIWATHAQKSPDPNHKPVTAEVRKKLEALPLKWANYFEVSRKNLAVPRGGSEQVTLSDQCRMGVKDVKGEYIEVSQIGKGVPVLKLTQRLPKGEMLVLSGNAPDATGWLVVLKRVE